jgi:hypothetical protein
MINVYVRQTSSEASDSSRANALMKDNLFNLNGVTFSFRIALSTDSVSILDYVISDLIVK